MSQDLTITTIPIYKQLSYPLMGGFKTIPSLVRLARIGLLSRLPASKPTDKEIFERVMLVVERTFISGMGRQLMFVPS